MQVSDLEKKWKEILHLRDWYTTVHMEKDCRYKKMEKLFGFDPGTTRGLNSITAEREDSQIFLNERVKDELELYLVHELVHILPNEMDELIAKLIELAPDGEAKSVLKVCASEMLEKLVWRITHIVLDMDQRSVDSGK